MKIVIYDARLAPHIYPGRLNTFVIMNHLQSLAAAGALLVE